MKIGPPSIPFVSAGVNAPLVAPSPAREWIASAALGVLARRHVASSAQRRPRCEADELFGSIAPSTITGARRELDPDGLVSKAMIRFMERVWPATDYRRDQVPTSRELPWAAHHRFRYLDNYATYAHHTSTTGSVPDQHPEAEIACRLLNHPTLKDIQIVLDCALQNDTKTRGKGQPAFWNLWNRNVIKYGEQMNGRPFEPTGQFLEAFPELVAEMGPLAALCSIMDQAFELERFVEYISGSLDAIHSLPSGLDTKALYYADLSPSSVFAATSLPHLVVPGDPRNHAELNYEALKGIRLRHHSIDAPEGARWHCIPGHTALDFILHYLFQTEQRFAVYRSGAVEPEMKFSKNSYTFRLALNILAFIDHEEAAAHLKLRLRAKEDSALEMNSHAKLP